MIDSDKQAKLFARYAPRLKTWLEAKNMPPHVWTKFAVFTDHEQEQLLPELERLDPNQNSLAEVIDLLAALSKRDGKNSIFGDIPHTFAAKDVDALKISLKQRRYPRLMSQKAEFDSLIDDFGLPKGISVTPSAFFENDSLEIRLKARSAEELGKLIDLIQKKDWEAVFKVVS